MLEVICDTSFLINLATRRIKNISTIEHEIGNIRFVVPETVLEELKRLQDKKESRQSVEATETLNFIKDTKMKVIPIYGRYPDDAILQNVKNEKRGLVATMDRDLKKKIKKHGGSIVSFSRDRIVLE